MTLSKPPGYVTPDDLSRTPAEVRAAYLLATEYSGADGVSCWSAADLGIDTDDDAPEGAA